MATTAFSSQSAPPGASGDRSLPHNADAERTVLGAILVDNQAFNSAAEILTRDDFYRDAHRRIFEGMATLAEKSEPIDLVTLKNELTRTQSLDGRELTIDTGGFFKFRKGPEWMVGMTEDLEPSGPAIDVAFRLGVRW